MVLTPSYIHVWHFVVSVSVYYILSTGHNTHAHTIEFCYIKCYQCILPIANVAHILYPLVVVEISIGTKNRITTKYACNIQIAYGADGFVYLAMAIECTYGLMLWA